MHQSMHREEPAGSSRAVLRGAIREFGASLRHLALNVSDSVTQLQRTAELPPSASAREFKVVVQDLEEQLTDLAHNVQHLQRFTVESLSFEELLGHCTALYKSNRLVACQLHQHMQQQAIGSSRELQQPEHPRVQATGKGVSFTADFDEAPHSADEGGQAHGAGSSLKQGVSSSLRHRQQTPSFPRHGTRVCDSSDEEEEEAEGREQGSRAAAGPAAAQLEGRSRTLGGTGNDENVDPRLHLASKGAAPPLAGAQPRQQPCTAAKSWRPSLDSHASSTPDMFMLSPSLLALQDKYGSSAGTDANGSLQGLSISTGRENSSSPDDMDADPPGVLNGPSGLQGCGSGLSHESYLGSGLDPGSGDRRAAGGHCSDSQAVGDRGAQPHNRQQRLEPGMCPSEEPVRGSLGAAVGMEEEDTCCLYQELIRSRGVACNSNNTSMRSAQARQSGEERRSGAAGGRAAAAAPVGAGKGGRAQALQMSTALDQLEDLWVSSGQAALTPSRARQPRSEALQAALTPSRARSLSGHFTREAAKAAAAADAPQQLCDSDMSDAVVYNLPAPVAPAPAGPGPLLEHHTLSSAPSSFTPAAAQAQRPSGGLQVPSGAHGRVLSPGTSQLLSKVYGGAAGAAVEHARLSSKLQGHTPAQTPGFQQPAVPSAGSQAVPGSCSSGAPAEQQQQQAAAGPPGAQLLVSAAQYAALPAFCRSQLTLEQLERACRDLSRLVSQRSQAGEAGEFSLGDLEQQGMSAASSKVFINCLIKLGHAELQRAASGGFAYVLKS